jgi:hypothetical protein
MQKSYKMQGIFYYNIDIKYLHQFYGRNCGANTQQKVCNCGVNYIETVK